MKIFRNSRSSAWPVGVIALALAAFAVGCAEEVPVDADINPVSIVFDPATSTIPLPSDLALEDDGTMPNLGAELPASAQADFYAYVGTLHGWLPASNTITIPVSGKLDPASVTAEAVRVFKFNGEEPATQLEVGDVSVNEVVTPGAEEGDEPTTRYEIAAKIATPLTLGTKYGFVLAGDIKDADKNPVVRSQAIHFATMESPLVDANDVATVELLAGKDETAVTLEGLRQFLAPTVTAALAADSELSRGDILSANAWHTATDAFAVFDPTGGNVPFPNEFIRTGDNGTVALPLDPEADALTKAVINELNQRSGFSNTANGWLPFAGAPLDPATVNSDTILLARTAGLVPIIYGPDRYFLEYQADWNLVTFGPLGNPFDQNQLFGPNPGENSANNVTAGIITTGVKDINGLEVKPSEAFVFLRSNSKIADADGKSLVKELDDATAVALEGARLSYQQLFLAALAIGHGDRKTLANAWAFETDRSTDEQQHLSARALALAVDAGSITAVGQPGDAEAPTEGNIGLVQSQASFKTQNFLDPANPFGILAEPVEQNVGITISVPDTSGSCGTGPFPIVILGHGLGGERANAVAIFADALAAHPYCLASVALDFPLHGERAIEGVPFMSANAIATKNNFLQAGVDLTILTETIKDGGFENLLDTDSSTDFIDEDSIGYAGQSLGAILGTNFVATNEDVTVAALNVPGGRLTEVIVTGALGAEILEQLPPAGSFSFFQTIALLQWTIEPADPWLFAPHIQSHDSSDKDADKPLFAVTYDVGEDTYAQGARLSNNQVIVQMAGQDTTIPNPTTELLAAAMGVSLEDTTFAGAEHGFIGGTDAAADCAKAQVATWLSSGLSSGTAALTSDLLNACNP